MGYTIPEKAKKQMSLNRSGDKNYLYGKHLSIETKRKMSEKRKEVRISPEQLAKRLEYWRGRDGTMKGRLGVDHPAFGRTRPDSERKQIQSNMPHKVSVIMLDKDTNQELIRFVSKKESARYLQENGVCNSPYERSIVSTITRAIKINSVSYGYRWKEV